MLANDPASGSARTSRRSTSCGSRTRRSRSLLRAARASSPRPGQSPCARSSTGSAVCSARSATSTSCSSTSTRRRRRWRARTPVRSDACARRLVAERRDAQRAARRRWTASATFGFSTRSRARRTPRPERRPTPLAEIAAEAFRRLRKAAKALPRTSDGRRAPRVRIETKRARYATELAAPELGKRGARFVERAKDGAGRDR